MPIIQQLLKISKMKNMNVFSDFNELHCKESEIFFILWKRFFKPQAQYFKFIDNARIITYSKN